MSESRAKTAGTIPATLKGLAASRYLVNTLRQNMHFNTLSRYWHFRHFHAIWNWRKIRKKKQKTKVHLVSFCHKDCEKAQPLQRTVHLALGLQLQRPREGAVGALNKPSSSSVMSKTSFITFREVASFSSRGLPPSCNRSVSALRGSNTIMPKCWSQGQGFMYTVDSVVQPFVVRREIGPPLLARAEDWWWMQRSRLKISPSIMAQ